MLPEDAQTASTSNREQGWMFLTRVAGMRQLPEGKQGTKQEVLCKLCYGDTAKETPKTKQTAVGSAATVFCLIGIPHHSSLQHFFPQTHWKLKRGVSEGKQRRSGSKGTTRHLRGLKLALA